MAQKNAPQQGYPGYPPQQMAYGMPYGFPQQQYGQQMQYPQQGFYQQMPGQMGMPGFPQQGYPQQMYGMQQQAMPQQGMKQQNIPQQPGMPQGLPQQPGMPQPAMQPEIPQQPSLPQQASPSPQAHAPEQQSVAPVQAQQTPPPEVQPAPAAPIQQVVEQPVQQVEQAPVVPEGPIPGVMEEYVVPEDLEKRFSSQAGQKGFLKGQDVYNLYYRDFIVRKEAAVDAMHLVCGKHECDLEHFAAFDKYVRSFNIAFKQIGGTSSRLQKQQVVFALQILNIAGYDKQVFEQVFMHLDEDKNGIEFSEFARLCVFLLKSMKLANENKGKPLDFVLMQKLAMLFI